MGPQVGFLRRARTDADLIRLFTTRKLMASKSSPGPCPSRFPSASGLLRTDGRSGEAERGAMAKYSARDLPLDHAPLHGLHEGHRVARPVEADFIHETAHQKQPTTVWFC